MRWIASSCATQLFAVMAIFCGSGCAVVSSYRTNVQAPEGNGVSYYLPKKDVVVTLTIGDAASAPTFGISSSEAYPDISTRFVARYRQSLIGTDKLNIGVTSKGLLTSTNADFKSQLPTILENLAKAAGAAAGLPAPGKAKAEFKQGNPKKCTCKAKGTYTERFAIDPDRDPDNPYDTTCGYEVSIGRIGKSAAKIEEIHKVAEGIDKVVVCPCRQADPTCNKSYCKGYNGLFYRQQEPYEVKISDPNNCGLPTATAVVFSPSNSPLEFLPVERGLFADANTTFAFEDGSLTSYEQSKSSELSALTALPADLASAYFGAIGTIFEKRETAVTNQANFEKALATLLLQEQKTAACKAAIAAKDAAAIDANCK